MKKEKKGKRGERELSSYVPIKIIFLYLFFFNHIPDFFLISSKIVMLSYKK